MEFLVNQNNRESQQILEDNSLKLGKQGKLVLKLLKEGEKLTVLGASLKYGVGDLRARIHGINKSGVVGKVKYTIMPGGFKEYYL
jgi:hypothetical protein